MVTIGLSGPAFAAIAASTVHGSRRIRAFSADPGEAVLRDLAAYVASVRCARSWTASIRWRTSGRRTGLSNAAASSASRPRRPPENLCRPE
jgi:hypothetical protein